MNRSLNKPVHVNNAGMKNLPETFLTLFLVVPFL